VCIALWAVVAHNIAQNRPDNFPSCPPDNHQGQKKQYFSALLAACMQFMFGKTSLASNFVLMLFAFVVLGLVFSVLCLEIGWEERLQNDLFYVV